LAHQIVFAGLKKGITMDKEIDKEIKIQMAINKMMGIICLVMDIPSISPCSLYRDNCWKCPYYNG
jgi:hypothetical protein